MTKTILLGFAICAAAFAGDGTFKVNVVQDSVIEGKAVKAGEYKISFENGNAVLRRGKESIEVPAREETDSNKVESTELTYTDNNNLREIHFGGSHTKIVFAGATATSAGM